MLMPQSIQAFNIFTITYAPRSALLRQVECPDCKDLQVPHLVFARCDFRRGFTGIIGLPLEQVPAEFGDGQIGGVGRCVAPQDDHFSARRDRTAFDLGEHPRGQEDHIVIVMPEHIWFLCR